MCVSTLHVVTTETWTLFKISLPCKKKNRETGDIASSESAYTGVPSTLTSYKGTQIQEHESESGIDDTEFDDCVHRDLFPIIPSARKLGLKFEDDMPRKKSFFNR